MTQSNDALELATPATGSPTSQSTGRSKPESGQLRADAVSLDVPVKVHGSRVTEVVRGITPHTEPFEEQTSTMIVFPQGGVLRMSTPVTSGQMVVLTNLKSGHDAICRIVKVRAYAQSQSYVEVEFTNRQPGYWGVHFPGEPAEPARPYVPPPPPPVVSVAPPASAEKSESKPAPAISWAPAAALQQPAERAPHPGKPESSFAQIGSREDVQPAASATDSGKKTPRPVALATPVSMADLRGDVQAAPPVHTSIGSGIPGEAADLSEELAESAAEAPPVALGRLAASASLSDASASTEKPFGARFGSGAMGISQPPADTEKKSGGSGLLIAGGVAALLVVALGGAFYLHLLPGGKAAPKSASSSTSAAAPAAPTVNSSTQPSAMPSVAPGPAAQAGQPNPALAPSAPVASNRAAEPSSERVSQAAVPARVQSSAPANQKPASRMPDMSASLAAHPVSSQRSASGDAEPAPTVEASGTSSGADLQGISVSSVLAPPPPAAEPAPAIKSGGQVKPPVLASSVMPIYPSMARSTGIEGNVVIDASIDAYGNVASSRVISGPPVLRQAAIDALHQWKYHPATLDGSAVPVHLTVTIQFHR